MSAVLPSYYGGDGGGDPPDGGQWQPSSGCAASGPKQGPRRKNKNLTLKATYKKNSNNPLEIDFEKGERGTYIAVGDNSDNFNSLVGTIIAKIPYHFPSWKEVPPEHTCTIFDELQHYYNVDPHINGEGGDILKEGLHKYFGNIYKSQKYKFAKKFFDSRGGVKNKDALREDPPAHVRPEDWRKFVDFRCSENFQKRSRANKGCRSQQEIVVRHGRKNLAQIRFENRNVSPIDLYKRMRTNKDGEFTERQAARNHARMLDMRNDPNNTLSEEDIMQEVLGERRGWTRAVGQKLPKSVFVRGSSSNTRRKLYTAEDFHRMMAQYTAPLWHAHGMEPPPFNVDDYDDDGEDDDGEDDDGEDDDGEDDDGENDGEDGEESDDE